MPLESFLGPDVPTLLARAQATLGADAIVLTVRRTGRVGREAFEMVAADPLTAAQQRAAERVRATAPRGSVALRGSAADVTAPESDERAGRTRRALDAWLPPEPPPVPRRAPRPFVPGARPVAPPRPRGPKVIALVGPTGAGKTTTLAKLANHEDAFAGAKVACLTLDTYRVGAEAQTRAYAELSRIPMAMAWTPDEAVRAAKRFKDRDVLLVDTPGRGPRATGDLRDVQQRLLVLGPDEVHLVLPSGLQPALARRLVTAHLALGVTHLLPSKLDEWPDERGVFELAAQFGLPIRWIADGQEVPRDLHLAPAIAGVPAATPVGGRT